MFDSKYYKSIGNSIEKKYHKIIIPVSIINVLLLSLAIRAMTFPVIKDGEWISAPCLKVFFFWIPINLTLYKLLSTILFIIRFLSQPFHVCEDGFYYQLANHKEGTGEVPSVRSLLQDTRKHYFKYLLTYIVMYVKIILWSIPFVIPGLIKVYSYFLIPYIVTQNPDISFSDAKNMSERYMKGKKWNVFLMQLSLLGWTLLDFLSGGLLGILWFRGYENAIFAAFAGSLNIDFSEISRQNA